MSCSSKKLITAILIATVLVSGSLVYAGYSLGNSKLTDDMLDAAINRYVEKQQEEATKQQAAANQPQQVTQKDVSDDDAFLGDKNAPVTIVEFSEYQCPYCKRHVDQTVPQIMKKYIETGKVKYVFRDYPLDFHPNAFPAALAAECAGDEGDTKYFEMHDALFKNQAELSEDKIKELAKEIGLNMKNFTNCYDNQKHKDEIAKDLEDGKKLGITGTPAFIINGWLIKGAQPYSAFESLIEQLLSE